MTYDLNYCTKCRKSPCKCDTESELRGRVEELKELLRLVNENVRSADLMRCYDGDREINLQAKITTTLEGK